MQELTPRSETVILLARKQLNEAFGDVLERMVKNLTPKDKRVNNRCVRSG